MEIGASKLLKIVYGLWATGLLRWGGTKGENVKNDAIRRWPERAIDWIGLLVTTGLIGGEHYSTSHLRSYGAVMRGVREATSEGVRGGGQACDHGASGIVDGNFSCRFEAGSHERS